MNRALKTFLLWLLIAALPIQGMAAVVKAFCGPGHHDSSPVAMSIAEHHHHAGSASHHHGIGDAGVAMTDLEAGGANDEPPGAEPIHKTAYCSACAACCVGAAAPPPATVATPVVSTFTPAVVFPSASFTGFIPAGLERPPRQLSA